MWPEFASAIIGIVILAVLTAYYLISVKLLRRRLGKRWRPSSTGRDRWVLMSNGQQAVDSVVRGPTGRWRTKWGREFDSLLEAARWVEAKHDGDATRPSTG